VSFTERLYEQGLGSATAWLSCPGGAHPAVHRVMPTCIHEVDSPQASWPLRSWAWECATRIEDGGHRAITSCRTYLPGAALRPIP